VDICGGVPWTDMDIRDHTAALKSGAPQRICVGQRRGRCPAQGWGA